MPAQEGPRVEEEVDLLRELDGFKFKHVSYSHCGAAWLFGKRGGRLEDAYHDDDR